MQITHSLSFAAALALTPMSAMACQVDHFNFVFGSDTSANVSMRSAEACKLGFRVNPRAHMSSSGLVQAPQHGSVTQADQTHWMYRPARGYSGQDVVVAKVSGDNMGNRRITSGDSNITWTINVAP